MEIKLRPDVICVPQKPWRTLTLFTKCSAAQRPLNTGQCYSTIYMHYAIDINNTLSFPVFYPYHEFACEWNLNMKWYEHMLKVTNTLVQSVTNVEQNRKHQMCIYLHSFLTLYFRFISSRKLPLTGTGQSTYSQTRCSYWYSAQPMMQKSWSKNLAESSNIYIKTARVKNTVSSLLVSKWHYFQGADKQQSCVII